MEAFVFRVCGKGVGQSKVVIATDAVDAITTAGCPFAIIRVECLASPSAISPCASKVLASAEKAASGEDSGQKPF